MNNNIRCLFLVIYILLSTQILAAPADTNKADLERLLAQAHQLKLSKHPYWLKLLRYRIDPGTHTASSVSEVKSSDFFLSPTGYRNPADEMAATIRSVFAEPGENPDNHAQCRYIARFQWLKKMLDWNGVAYPLIHCEAFEEFSMQNQIKSVSLVYASGYLSNPASFYGHPFIKFNSSKSVADSDLLDTVVNFGAIIPENENGLIYIFKGLFGGYHGRYTEQRFYSFNHVYGENDLRDLWEYELDLSDDEIKQIVAFVWEVLNKDYTYYFLKENCALRMAELIELIINEPLLPDIPWAMPSVIFENLMRVKRDGEPLVKKVKWVPSRQHRVDKKYTRLSAKQQRLAKNIAEEKSTFGDYRYASLPEEEKIALLDMLIDYYEFRIIQDRDNAEFNKMKHIVLLERVKLTKSVASDAAIEPTHSESIKPPHEGPLPFMFQTGFIYNDIYNNGAKFRFRPAYYDNMSIDRGKIPDSTLSIMDTELILRDSELRLRKIDIINIENINTPDNDLPGAGGLSWNVKLSYLSHDLACEDCLITNLTGGIGKAFKPHNKFLVYGMLDLFVESKYVAEENIGVTPRIAIVTNPITGWKSFLEVGQKSYVNGEKSDNTIIRWINRFGDSRDWDVRLSYEKHIAHEVSAVVSMYW